MLTKTCCLVYIAPNAIQWCDEITRKARLYVSSLESSKVRKDENNSTPFELAILNDKMCTFSSQPENGCLQDNEYLIFRNYYVGERLVSVCRENFFKSILSLKRFED